MTSTEAMPDADPPALEGQKPEDQLGADGLGEDSATDAQADVTDNNVNGLENGHGREPTKVPKKLYFLRLPKPDLSDKQLEKARLDSEVAQYRDACDRALAAAKLANEHRYQRREEYQTAFAQFGVSKADRDTLLQRLRPMRDENRQASEKRQQANAQKAQLPAATTAELERKIAELEQKQAHETMDRKSENALIADIRKLAKSRAAVARFEADNPRIEVSKEERDSMNMGKTELEGQLKIVQEEYTLAKAQMDERWALLQDARSSQEEASNEFQRLKDLKDAKFKERSALRDELQEASNQFYENRRFSQKVRKLVGAGDLEQAMEICAEETESLLSDLLGNQEAYTEYVDTWELQRAHAVSEAPMEVSRAAPANGKSKANGAASSAASKMTADADAIVQGIMAELAGRGPAPAAADALASALPAPAAQAAITKPPKALKAPKAAAAPVAPTTPPPERAPAQLKPAPASAPAPSAPRSKAAPALDDTFVPPAAAAPAKPVLTDAQLKAKVRQEQAAKAAEAEERKRKKEEAKTKKAEQAKEAARLKEEAEEQKKASDQARVEREAQKQREGAAKKKELEARRKAKAEEKNKTIKARGGAKTGPVSKAPKKRITITSFLREKFGQHKLLVYLAVVVVFLLVIVAASRS